ncbi:MAG: hypothetical protein PVJ84_20285 [Desulfobacteraceae bacterium]|jgi:hypothetical protein
MDKDMQNSKPKLIHKLFNAFLMVFNVCLTVALYSILDLARRWYIGTDPETSEYSGPALADFFLRKELIIIPILLIVFMVVKEFKVKPIKKRVHINLFISAGIFGHAMFIAAVPFIFSLI